MAHITINGTTTVQATEYHTPASEASESRLDATLRRAERLVKDLAPPPSPEDLEYPSTAADAELAVFEHLHESLYYVERDVVGNATTVYRDRKALEDLVRDAMGRFYVGPRAIEPNPPDGSAGAPSVLTNVSEHPLW